MSERRAEQLGSVPTPGQGADARAGNGRPPWPPTGAAAGGDGRVAPEPAHDPEVAGSRRRRREHAREAGRARRSGAWSWVRETAIILVSALVLSLVVKTFLVQAFFIPSQSMHDTLIENDRILVSKLTPGPRDLRRGDVVVFKDPGGWLPPTAEEPRGPVAAAVEDGLTWIGLLPQDAGEHLVKRVIGLPGDRVACAGPGEPVTVNGVPIDEPYLAAGAQPSEEPFDVVVPERSVWVMGDNRQRSADSRFNQGRPGGGSVPMDNIVGVAFVTVWPLDRVTVLRNPSDTFAGVPDPS
ncbi:signal peptidase I [Cellulomonas sp. JZ18]|uniref:signal peptidase I n=1 Tax=Cellulomonas sp. JZ18 TaxID=2654191 RepID=UPI0012D47B30|nr:signal peptidase I [Cellulomonas sp. JZ18]QGQ19675.1 signal peptidase I [Cellulomonas sp. JZ18]